MEKFSCENIIVNVVSTPSEVYFALEQKCEHPEAFAEILSRENFGLRISCLYSGISEWCPNMD